MSHRKPWRRIARALLSHDDAGERSLPWFAISPLTEPF